MSRKSKVSQLIFSSLAYHDPGEILQILLSCVLKKAGHNKNQIATLVSQFDRFPKPLKSIRKAFVEQRPDLEKEMFELLDKNVDLDDILETIKDSCDDQDELYEGFGVDEILDALKKACETMSGLYVTGSSDERYWTGCSNILETMLNSLPEDPGSENRTESFWKSCSRVIMNNLNDIPNWMEI